MEDKRKAKRVTFLVGVLVATLVAIAAWLYRHDIRSWYLIRRDFESLGENEQGYPEYRHRKTGIVFVRVPAGTFWMGTSEEEAAEAIELHVSQVGDRSRVRALWLVAQEQPAHEVGLSPFLIAKHEVTQAEWKLLMAEDDWLLGGVRDNDLPAHSLTGDDWRLFCQKAGFSFPTEAQWEYACRAGGRGNFSGTGSIDEMGWYYSAKPTFTSDGSMVWPLGEQGPKPVEQKQPNSFGLFDMHGNVAEWCADDWDPEFYSKQAPHVHDPVCSTGPGGDRRSVRGGGTDIAFSCRSAARRGVVKDEPSPDVGFRPVYNLR